MAASAAAGNRVGGQTDGTAQPGQRIKTAAGASAGVTSSTTRSSLLVMGPEARTTLCIEVSLSRSEVSGPAGVGAPVGPLDGCRVAT